MKKFMYFAAALLVLAGCKKDNALNNAPEGTPFKKGQQVTLTVGTGNNTNQAAPRKVAGTDNGTQIDFTWEEGDQILVRVGGESAVFTLTTGAGTETGTFSGTMPAGGTTFDIQYPIETPDLSAQTYTATKTIPTDKMLFAAIGCTLGNTATLYAQNAMVQLNLYGTDKTVGKIVFTNKTVSPAVSYTLTCTEGVEIGTSAASATLFYMVVPAGEYQFEVEVWDAATTPAKICSFATSAAKTFTAGQCLNMPAKEVAEPHVPVYVDLGLQSGTMWADCNVGATCGSTAESWYGDFFAWGETTPKDNYASDWSNYFDFKEMSGSTPTFNKYYFEGLTLLEKTEDVASVQWGESWCMPTREQMQELYLGCNFTWETDYSGVAGLNGYKMTSKSDETNFIFLPAAGYQDGTEIKRFGNNGLYWTKKLYTDYSSSSMGCYLSFYYYNEYSAGFMLVPSNRYCGLVVRPVAND